MSNCTNCEDSSLFRFFECWVEDDGWTHYDFLDPDLVCCYSCYRSIKGD